MPRRIIRPASLHPPQGPAIAKVFALMPQAKLRVFFLGSGEFAVPLLEAVCAAESFALLGIGSQPDRPAGRKRALTPTPVAKRAGELGVACERIASVNDEAFLARLESSRPDLLIVVSFGQLLKERLLALPRLGCLNVHASLLPRHRGASPIASAILAGDTKTGVCFMRMDKGLDTGPVYRSCELPLNGTETKASLETSLAELAAANLESAALGVASRELPPLPQDSSLASVSKKIRKQDGSLDWREDAQTVLRKTRAFNPWPGASFSIETERGRQLAKIVSASLAEGSGAPGQVLRADRREWTVACGRGAVSILRLVPEGRREMNFSDFLHGTPLKPGDVILNGPIKRAESSGAENAPSSSATLKKD